MECERKRIRNAFGAAADRYDAIAGVQRIIATELATKLSSLPDAAQILDAGCGTGQAKQFLLSGRPDTRIVSLDAAFGMCAKTAGMAVCADIDLLPFRSASFDLYWSSLAWQWTTPKHSIDEAARVLKPGALLAVATLGPGTLDELRDAFRSIDAKRHVREFFAPSAYPELLNAAGFKAVEIACHPVKTYAQNLHELLHGIRELGANTVGSNTRHGLLGRNAWNKLTASYESRRDPNGLPATYDAIFIIAVKG